MSEYRFQFSKYAFALVVGRADSSFFHASADCSVTRYEQRFDDCNSSFPRGRLLQPNYDWSRPYFRISPLPAEDVEEIELLLDGKIPNGQ